MNIWEIILTISGSVLSIGLSARLAITQYFRHREYELVKERYLEGAVDLLASNLEEQLKRHQHNWTRALNLVKQFRELKVNFILSEIDNALLEVRPSELNIIAHYRLGEILGDQSLWQAYQHAFAFVMGADAFIRDELLVILRKKSGKELTQGERDEIVKIATDQLLEQSKELNRYFEILKHFHTIARILENEKLNFNSIKELRERKDIKAVLREVSERFCEMEEIIPTT